MKELLMKLSTATKELEQQKEFYKKKKEEFEEQMKTTSEVIANCNDEIKNLKSALTPLAIAEFEKTGEKKVSGGLAIQERKVLNYEEAKAFNFAYEKRMFLNLDKKGFEKVAESLNLDFVSTSKEIKVTFPKEIKL